MSKFITIPGNPLQGKQNIHGTIKIYEEKTIGSSSMKVEME